MGYRNNPFNPLAPTPNQVITELIRANNNFDILARAFVGDNPETYAVKLADQVDGFHASLTPEPYVIVPLNANGVLDLSETYVKSGVYTFRRVDLSGATSDYNLQVGEEAVVSFENMNIVPLRVSIQEPSTPLYPAIYNIIIGVYQASGDNVEIDFFPNYTTYFGQMRNLMYRHTNSGWESWSQTLNRFFIDVYGGVSDLSPFFANLYAVYYGALQPKLLYGVLHSNLSISLYSGQWNNTTTAWISLGSFRMYPNSLRLISGTVLVRRLA